MGTRYVLTPELREELKKPLGTLVRGSFAETMKRLREMVQKDNPPMIVAVGDTVSRNLCEHHFHPKLLIIDNKCMRKNVRPVTLPAEKTVHVQNPQGTLTQEAINATREAIEDKRSVRMVVEGEEDLLTIVALLYAPENSYIVYGQPLEGIVVVKATQNKRTQVAAILKAMENCSKN